MYLDDKDPKFIAEFSRVIDEKTTKYTDDEEHNVEYTHVDSYLNMELGLPREYYDYRVK